MKKNIPPSEKFLLTLEEASAYFSVGVCRLRELTNERPELMMWCGGKRLIRRKQMEQYLSDQHSV